jgi:hypothetical protein
VPVADNVGKAGDAARAQTEQDAIDDVRVSGAQTTFVAKLGGDYQHGPNLLRATRFRRHTRGDCEPLYRPLRVYMADPAESGYAGRTAVVLVPYEALSEGPVGAFLEVVDDGIQVVDGPAKLDLNKETILIGQGLKPSAADPLFHR